MGGIFIISDLHFSHYNMAIKRGFNSIEEHDNHIIEQWNSVVKKKDSVFILGDITMEKVAPYPLLDKLNGVKKVVGGNHDKPQHTKVMLNHINAFAGMVKYKKFILTHCPIHPKELTYRFDRNIHGHVHENTLNNPRYINVSAEVVDYKPVRISDIPELKLTLWQRIKEWIAIKLIS